MAAKGAGSKVAGKAVAPKQAAKKAPARRPVTVPAVKDTLRRELVILTGMSGAGKASALKTFEDLGYYSVDNLPLDLIPRFADLVRTSAEIRRAALVIDVREGIRLERFPAILKKVRKVLNTRVLFLEASEDALIRRFFRDATAASARPRGDGRAVHPGGAQAAGPRTQCRRHHPRHDQVQRARAAGAHQRAV